MDAVFSLEELREFALLAYNYSRVHRNQEAAFMVTGYASLKCVGLLHRIMYCQQLCNCLSEQHKLHYWQPLA